MKREGRIDMSSSFSAQRAVLGTLAAMTACSSSGAELDRRAPLGRDGTTVQAKRIGVTQGLGSPALDPAGQILTTSSTGFDGGTTNGFFADLGTNGRTCGTCHVESQGWTISAAGVQSRPHDDPIFNPFDGADCPATSAGQRSNSALSTVLMDRATIRIAIAIPGGAGFTLVSATNPQHCAIPPGSDAARGQLFMFRRPLPATNLIFDTTIMFDGRETLQKIATTENEQNTDPLLFDLRDQANAATMGHAQGASIAGTQAQADIVTFEMSLATAQRQVHTANGTFVLDEDGVNGGPAYIANVLAPAFFVGVNDPLVGPFTNANFTLYRAWEPSSPGFDELRPGQQAIGRGEVVFNETTFVVHDVPGLNSVSSNPLFNPADPLANKDITAGCALCHNSPNIGNHSTSLPINIGVTMAEPTNNDGTANDVLSVGLLPVYTLQNSSTGATVAVTDPGRALSTGKWIDVGKTKGPNLRGLASRAPYFHNGSAKDLLSVVKFYDARFDIGLTDAQISDLVAFLSAL
jgi:hypothetical protein